MLFPLINDYPEPPTIYSILNAYLNFDSEEQTKIKDLAKSGRGIIFDFTYPLADVMSKEDFESMILNRFMMRRIGFETVTAFKLALNVKLNEVMPMYNKLITSLDGWDLFNDGDETIRDLTDNKNGKNNVVSNNTTNVTAKNISDQRYSDTPETAITDLHDGKYVTDANYNTDDTTSDTKTDSTSDITSEDHTSVHESVKHSPADKMHIYTEFIRARQNIYTMIFRDLDSLFYQII